MNYAEYEKMENFEKKYWWHLGRLYLIQTLLKKHLNLHSSNKLFEIGSGTGATLNMLAKFGDVSGIDISQEAVKFSEEKGFKNIICGDINEDNMSSYYNTYDAVLALDVLEHIQDDTKTMNIANELLKPNGLFIITVPAHKYLWSEHDEALHHKRRYHRKELVGKLKDNGFEIVKHSYFVMTLFFPILLFRTLNTILGRHIYPKTSYVLLPEFLNNLGTNLLKFETKILSVSKLPIGTSLVIVARKSK